MEERSNTQFTRKVTFYGDKPTPEPFMHRGAGLHEERKVTFYGEAKWYSGLNHGKIPLISGERSPFMGPMRNAEETAGRE